MDLLVVEDEPLVRHSVVESLRDAGFDVSDASHAEAALEAAEAAGPPAVLVADLDLGPGSRLGGVALAAAMRRRWPWLGVLYVSGDPESLAACRPGARERCLAKPFSVTRLVRAVHDLLPDLDGPALLRGPDAAAGRLDRLPGLGSPAPMGGA
jgi:CheY-like chemotaxis protein